MFLSSQNWFVAWISMEMNTVTFLCLMFYKTKKKMETIMLYFALQSMTSMFLLYGISSQESWAWMTFCPPLIVMMSLIMKLGGAPFNNWFISLCFFIYHKTPFWLMLTLQKMIPLMLLISNTWKPSMLFCLTVMASVIMGAAMNLKQNTMKMILILSSLSNLSWMMAASAWKSTSWETYFMVYSLMVILIMPYLKETKQTTMSKKSSVDLTLIMLTLGALPPLMGFFPKLVVSMSMLKNTLLVLLLSMLIFSAMDIFVYSRISCAPLMKSQSGPLWNKMKSPMNMPLFQVCTLTIILLFLS